MVFPFIMSSARSLPDPSPTPTVRLSNSYFGVCLSPQCHPLPFRPVSNPLLF